MDLSDILNDLSSVIQDLEFLKSDIEDIEYNCDEQEDFVKIGDDFVDFMKEQEIQGVIDWGRYDLLTDYQKGQYDMWHKVLRAWERARE